MALAQFSMPLLPIPPSWFPGHMMKFTRMLPALLSRTDVVLEIRDARLPLTSINRTLEGALRKWRLERGWDPHNPSRRIVHAQACEHVVVLNKRDLVPKWGLERNEAKIPPSAVISCFLASTSGYQEFERPSSIAKEHPHAMELNVLVLGMPNVGKSTLLNALRNIGIRGRTPKAFQTSAQPGMTQALSNRLKLSLDPPVYAYDSPGVMLPYLGSGIEGAERGVKLALISGIKESLYDTEALAGYLLYRLNVLNPISPAYLQLLPAGASPTVDLYDFLTQLGQRMGMVKRGAQVDIDRAAVFFVKWWREDGGLISASSPLADISETSHQHAISGWGFDFQWTLTPEEKSQAKAGDPILTIQNKMEECIDAFIEKTDQEEQDEANVSPTQKKKQAILEEKAKRRQKQANRFKR